jgi:hypothetical protein
MALDPNAGWALGQLGTPTQSTMPLSPQQAQQIQHTTAAMQQPMPPPATQQQTAMMSGLFGPQGNMGQNLGSMTGAFVGGPAYGGGNIFTDAYGGNAAAPLPGLTAADYG